MVNNVKYTVRAFKTTYSVWICHCVGEGLAVTFRTKPTRSPWQTLFVGVCIYVRIQSRKAFGFPMKCPYNCGNLAKTSSVLTSNRCEQSSKEFLSDTLKQSKRQSIFAAGKQGGRELSGREIFSEQGLGVCVCVFAHVCVHSRSRKASWYEKCDSGGSCCHVVSHWESMNYPQSFQHSSFTAGSIKLFWRQTPNLL